MTSPPKRRWFAFRLRTLLVVVVVLCAVLTPLAIKVKKARDQKKVVEWVLKNGGSVTYDWEDDGEETPRAPKSVRGLFGDEFVQTVRSVKFLSRGEVSFQQFLQERELWGIPVSDVTPLKGLTDLQELWLFGTDVSDLSPLRRLTKLQVIQLGNTKVSDLSPLHWLANLRELGLVRTQVSDLSPLNGLTKLHWLALGETSVNDVSPLQGLTNLEWLDLSRTKVTDLFPIKGLTKLRELSLIRTQVKDLSPLEGLTDLRILHLEWTLKVTAEQVARLRKALPNCKIFP